MDPPSNNHNNNENSSKQTLAFVLQRQLLQNPGISQENLQTLCRKLYPVELSSNAYTGLCNTMVKYFAIQGNKNRTFEAITADVVCMSSAINESLGKSISNFLKKEQVRKKLVSAAPKNSSVQTQKNQVTGILESLQFKHKYGSKNKTPSDLLSRGFDAFSKQSVQHHADIAQKYVKQKNLVPNLVGLQKVGKKCPFCEKQFQEYASLECEDCGQIFHKKCQPRKNNCLFCQLENMNPLKRVKRKVFVGILRKGTKRHQIQFRIDDLLQRKIAKKEKQDCPVVQIRSIRVKETYDSVANYINLFPDACTIMVNNKLIKEFVPLHKQSSLKYRRDDSVRIDKQLQQGINRVFIQERITKNDIKHDERIDPENHLIGIYEIEEDGIPKIPNKIESFLMRNQISVRSLGLKGIGKNDDDFMKNTETLEFTESEATLKQALLSNEQEISCQTLKVPLMCSLTLQKMKKPGRTIFCRHYACFDIKNFFLLNSKANIPKWQCPICRVPAYKFKIDPIISCIIALSERIQGEMPRTTRDQNELVQAIFNSDLTFSIINKDGDTLNPETHLGINSIYDLPIEGIHKRFRQQNEEKNLEQQELRKRIKGQDMFQMNKQLDRPFVEKSGQKEGCQLAKSQRNGQERERQPIKRGQKFVLPPGSLVVDLSD